MNTITKARRTRRVVTLDDTYNAQTGFYETITVTPGDIVCLVRVTDTMTGKESHTLTTQPRTNVSHEIKWHGWLGTTDDIAENALGAWRVVSIARHDAMYAYDSDTAYYQVSLVEES